MTDQEKLHTADKLRDPITAIEPDPRAVDTSSFRSDKSSSMAMLAKQHQMIEAHTLTTFVPLSIRIHFETARNLYLYAWFVYRFYPVAEKHVLATLEFALRERLVVFWADKNIENEKFPRGFKALIEAASKKGLISNSGLRRYERVAMQSARERVSWEKIREMQELGLHEIEYDDSRIKPLAQDYSANFLETYAVTLPAIRNEYAHGSSMLHSMVLNTFEIVSDLINQLFEPKSQG